MNKSILFVDDEIQILKSLQRLFLGGGYSVFMAESGEKALEILENSGIDLIITDVLMRGMGGYTLLKEVKKRYPSVSRIVLSGHVEADTLLKIQKNCLAKLYLTKPWQNQELIRIVEQVFHVEKILKERNYFEMINGLEFLPAYKNTEHQLNKLIERDCDITEISEFIGKEPAITAKVLQVANSALYGVKTGSVEQAVTYLGLLNIKNIVLSASLYKGFEGSKNLFFHRELNVLWKHSIMTNHILSFLYEKLMQQKIPHTCAMAGLLHDIGKIILLSKHTVHYLKMIKPIILNADRFYYYEEMEFGESSHSEIGGYLLSWWELPLSIVESALYHHHPLDENVIDRELVALVHMADIYSWNSMSKNCSIQIQPEILKIFDMTREESDALCKEMKQIHSSARK